MAWKKIKHLKLLIFLGLSITLIVSTLAVAEPVKKIFPKLIIILGDRLPDPVIHSKEVLLLQKEIKEKVLEKETCEQQVEIKYADKCYWELAKQNNQSSLCDQIGDTDKRDTCYFYFAFKKDYTVCSKLTDVYLKNACFSLKGQYR